jgi:pilus assembly protein CpaF
MTSGHGGCLSTIHATSPRDALGRLETLALMNELELPLWALRAQIASGIDAVVQTERCTAGARRVSEIARVELEEAGYRLTRIYACESSQQQEPDT